MTTQVHDNDRDSRYEITRDGERVGLSEYQRNGERVTFLHTEVDPTLRGEGLGEQLVSGALDDVRKRGERVVARCPYVKRFITEHPEYQDLVEPLE
jgi:predicted GNAT family acetyltransferase